MIKILLDNRLLHDEGNDCVLSMDGADFLAPNYGKSGITTNSSILGCISRLLFPLILDGFVGLVSIGTLESGMTLRFFVCLS